MAQPQLPKKIGKYTIVERIGRGGMGYVYRATDPLLKRDIALKTMLKDVSEDPELRTRFMREAQSAGGLRHPNIVTIYDLGEDDEGCPFIAMEFLTGTDLEHIIKARVEMELQKKLDMVIQTAVGLDYAHKNGIIHRDIKPANIRILDNGEIKIMDFGIAKMTASRVTRTGMIMGTPHYMAPEQIRGETVDNRADIFSLGVVLYELLVCRKPFSGDNPTTVLFKIIHSDPEPLADGTFTPPEGLEEVILKALAKNQEDRYQTCEEFAADLIGIYARLQPAESLSQTPLPYSYPGRTPRPTTKAGTTGSPSIPSRPPSIPPTGTPKTGAAKTVAAQTVIPDQTQQQPPSLPAPPTAIPTPSAETQVQPQTLATASPVMPSYEPVSDTNLTPANLTPATSASRPVSVEAENWKKWLLLGAGAVLVISLGLYMAISAYNKFIAPPPSEKPPEQIIKKDEPPVKIVPPPVQQDKPVQDQPKEVPPPVVVQGRVSLNILPWAQIQQIKTQDGRQITPPVSTTPCLIQMDIGTYEFTLVNPGYQPLVVQVEVKENSTTQIRRRMRGFNDASAVDSLGL